MAALSLAVDQFTTMPYSFEEDLDCYQKAGVHRLELCERKLAEDPGERRDQVERLRTGGFEVVSVQPRVHALFPDRMAGDPKKPAERMGQLRRTVDFVAEELGLQDIPLVTIGGPAPGYDYRGAYRTALKEYPRLADYAAERNLRIAFEVIHPVLMNVDTFVSALRDGLQLVREVDRPNFGLVVDVWHLWHEPGIAERIEALGDRIFIVHLSDWPRDGLRHVDDRVVPGDGRIDLPTLLAAIRKAGYQGPYCLEILSNEDLPNSLWKADPVGLIGRSHDALTRMWDQSTSK